MEDPRDEAEFHARLADAQAQTPSGFWALQREYFARRAENPMYKLGMARTRWRRRAADIVVAVAVCLLVWRGLADWDWLKEIQRLHLAMALTVIVGIPAMMVALAQTPGAEHEQEQLLLTPYSRDELAMGAVIPALEWGRSRFRLVIIVLVVCGILRCEFQDDLDFWTSLTPVSTLIVWIPAAHYILTLSILLWLRSQGAWTPQLVIVPLQGLGVVIGTAIATLFVVGVAIFIPGSTLNVALVVLPMAALLILVLQYRFVWRRAPERFHDIGRYFFRQAIGDADLPSTSYWRVL